MIVNQDTQGRFSRFSLSEMSVDNICIISM